MAKKPLDLAKELNKRVSRDEPVHIDEAKAANWTQEFCRSAGYTEVLDDVYLISHTGKKRIERYRDEHDRVAYTPILFPNRGFIFQKYVSEQPLMDGILVIANFKVGDTFELLRDELVEVVGVNDKAVTLVRNGVKKRINFTPPQSRKNNPIAQLIRDIEGRLLFEIHSFRGEDTPMTDILMRDTQAKQCK